MPLRVELNRSRPVEGRREVHGADPKPWIQANAVFKAGRELSGWFFRQPTVTHISLPPPSSRRHETAQPSRGPPTLLHQSQPPSTPFIQRLPQELLQEIFHQYVQSYDAPGTSSRRVLEGSYQRIVTQGGARTTPMLLGHVCSSWRTLSFSTPTLWSRLCANRALLEDVPLFEFWLERSSTCPLDLTINQQLGDEEYDEGTELLVQAAFAHSPRWRKVELRLHSDMESLFSVDSPLQHVSLPLLIAAHLDLVDWTVQGCKILSQLISTSSSLRSVEFGTGCPAATDFSDIPWANLSSVALGCIEVTCLLELLPQMTALNSLTIDTLIIPWPPSPTWSSIITLQGLQSLSIERYSDLSPLLDNLTLPSLTNLTLLTGAGSSHPAEAGWSTVRRLVERSACPLGSLTWSGTGMDETRGVRALVEVTQFLPDLERLRVACAVGPVLVAALTLNQGQVQERGIFPHLRSLELPKCRASSGDVEKLVLSRPSLERFTLHFLREEHSVDLRLFESLKAQRPALQTLDRVDFSV